MLSTRSIVFFVPFFLSSCTVNTMRQVDLERTGNQEDVRFCKYEAMKSATQGGYSTRTVICQGLEDNDRKAQIFNACMEYRANLSRNPVYR